MAAILVASMPLNWLIYGTAAPYHLTTVMGQSEPFFVQRSLANAGALACLFVVKY